MDRLPKSAHFLVVRMTFAFEEFERLYILEIVQLYGVLVSIISDRDPRFKAQLWRSFQRAMGTQMRMSIVFIRRRTDSQRGLSRFWRTCCEHASWTSRVAERALALDRVRLQHSYQASIQIMPYEALYGRPCRSPVCWMEVGERPSTGSDLISDT